MKALHEIPDPAVIKACDAFLGDLNTMEIRDVVNQELLELGVDYRITREQIYPILGLARDRGYFMVTPPYDSVLRRDLAREFGLDEGQLHVVNVRKVLDHVAAAAAREVLHLIQQLAKKKKYLHLGMGGGGTTRRVVEHLAPMLRTAEGLPERLTIHALSTGMDVHRSETAPVSFFSAFSHTAMDIRFVGLFAQAVVKWEDYELTKTMAGVAKAFEALPKGGLDIVITSLGSVSHTHGDFHHLMKENAKSGYGRLKKLGWVGDVQYRPYSVDGPIRDNTEVRTMTLLELDDLIELSSRPDKHVVVVAGPCGRCYKTRADAVHPLLANPKLKLWTRFVLDAETARAVLKMGARR